MSEPVDGRPPPSASTTTEADAVLLSPLLSGLSDSTKTELIAVPASVALAVIVFVALSPTARDPTVQIPVASSMDPAEGDEEINVTAPTALSSMTTTFPASPGPLFVTVTV